MGGRMKSMICSSLSPLFRFSIAYANNRRKAIFVCSPGLALCLIRFRNTINSQVIAIFIKSFVKNDV